MTIKVAIGVGCRLGCPADVIESVVRQALDQIPTAGQRGLFTIRDKAGEPGLAEAARRLGLDLVALSREALRAQSAHVKTLSVQANRRFGVPSVAEAAALAGAGSGAELILPRIANQGATCAVAVTQGASRP